MGFAAILAACTLVEQQGSAQAVPPARPVHFRKKKDDRVEELMERVDEGKRSPFARTLAQLASDAPNWDELAKRAAAYIQTSTVLKQSAAAEIRNSADGYANAVEDLAAVKQQDRNHARSALKSLTASCADCHFKGGPGGKLEDD